ncbi:NOL1/NOP2/sun family putative RNA methylase [Aliikangiella coralliicola]|uniref:NOL1/NOP2/sun family putative RNA methylase n=1 Tax=Aliikangiella coralliicola TaxID=2592383 RepID=A0A545UDZ0_9GAMM|nr:NOL1/NOP2/sun family putative RNA methylase [Aliikangiella coralliicola]TQV87684.1 NOL1/NOP2/sun family putative RNA methylase [Aliikangiella coralliicola]
MSQHDPIQLTSGGELHPDYLQHARATFLNPEEESDFIAACGRPLRKSIRVNTLKISVENFKEIAAGYHWQLTPIPWCENGFWLARENEEQLLSLGNLPQHLQGLFYIQEASSMLPPVALLKESVVEQPLVADMAAAPGSKTTQLAAMLDNRGMVLANELSASRLKGLHSNLVRCGILNTCMSHQDARKIGVLMPGQFDYVLLDAPCGGEGTVRKDVNALKHWDIDKVEELGQLQRELILSAYQGLKPGGRLVYSTCTLSPQENQHVANYLASETDATIVDLNSLFDGAEKVATDEGYLLVLPHTFDSEGFFISCFIKPKDSIIEREPKSVYSTPFTKVSRQIRQKLSHYFQSQFGVDIEPDGYELKQRDKEIWLFPSKLAEFDQYLKINRFGMKVAQVFPNKIRSTHEFACCFGDRANRQVASLSKEQASYFYRGQNIELKDPGFSDGEILLCFENNVIGLGQNKKGKVKNGLPRELVKDNYEIK